LPTTVAEDDTPVVIAVEIRAQGPSILLEQLVITCREAR
jgi:hypothetical protein